MYRYFVLLAVLLTVSADDSEEITKCFDFLETSEHCCKTMSETKKKMNEEKYKECMHLPRIPGSCDRAICFATKDGFGTADGSIKIDFLEKDLEEKLSNNKEIFEAIKKTCFKGNWQNYGQEDDCDLEKMFACMHWQFVFMCQDFSNDGSCEGSKDLAKECLEVTP